MLLAPRVLKKDNSFSFTEKHVSGGPHATIV